MIGLCATVFFASHPTWANEHPIWVYAVYGITAVFLFFTILQFRPIQRLMGFQPQYDSAQNQRNPTAKERGVAVAGDMDRSLIDSSVGHRYNIGDSALKILGSPQPVVDSPRPNPVVLKFLRTQTSLLYWENNKWIETSHTEAAELGILLWIQNPLAGVGENPNPHARHIAAHIKFKGDFSAQAAIFSERAYWLGERENSVSIDPGKSKAVILGTYPSGVWKVWNNKIETMPPRVTAQTLRSGIYLDIQTPEFVNPVMCRQIIEVEVSLFEADSGRSIAQTALTIKHDKTEDVFSFIATGGV